MNDDFNFDEKPARGQGGIAMNMWDMLSILVLIITGGMVLYFAFIFINPDSSLNFLRPGAGVGSQLPTSTPTPLQLAATWTPSPTLEVTLTDTPRPTFTPFSTSTPFSLVPPTKTPKPTSTPKAPFTASVSQTDSTLIHPDLAANLLPGFDATGIDCCSLPSDRLDEGPG